jgi:1,4-alpha-glucan branching enzyme
MLPTVDVTRLDARGHVALVLHAHQPFVREPGGDPTHAESRLFAAISRCYLPLLEALAGLARERVPYRLALAISPSLLGMLTDRVVQTRYRRHLDASLASLERGPRGGGESSVCTTSGLDHEALRRVRRAFVETWSGDLVDGLRQLQDDGFVETLAGAATHAYLPLLASDPCAARAQIRIGLDEHHRILGRRATGFWLPEGAYDDGLDALLVEHGVEYCIAGAQAVTRGTPRPAMGVWMPIVSARGLVLIAPDGEARDQIDGTHGYAADPDYRAADVDTAASPDAARDRADHDAGAEETTGAAALRAAVRAKLEAHASNFVASRARQIEAIAGEMQHPPLVLAALDAELLGVRWLAGPEWLAAAIRKIAYDQHLFALVTPSDHLAARPIAQEVRPAPTGGDADGNHLPWLGGENDWIRVPLHRAAQRMRELARRHEDATGTTLRALDQAARELLLAQSGDWPYRMSQGPLVNDAVRRLRTHLARFARLAREIDAGAVDADWLAEIEAHDNLFPALDHRAFR